MQRIRPHQILCILADLAGFIRGQQFGADGSIQNIFQHRPGCCKVLRFRNGVNHPADHGLGNRRVDAVHAHMVAIIGAPTQSQFRKIAGTHNDAVYHTGIVHEDLGPLPGLRILVGSIVNTGIMANVCKMLIDGRTDIDLLAGDTQGLHQLPGIPVGAVRSAKARHGHTIDIRSRTAKLTHGFHGYQKCQGRIQAAGNTNNRIGISNYRKPLLQSRNLDLEYGHAPFHAILTGGRNKRQLFQMIQLTICPQRFIRTVLDSHRRDFTIQRHCILHTLILPAHTANLTQVSILHQQIIPVNLVLVFCQNTAILSNNAVTGEHQILGRLGTACRSIGIDTAADGGLMLHKTATVAPFTYHFIGSRQIQNHFCTVQALQSRGGHGCPQILTYFHAHQRTANAEQKIPSHWNHGIAGQAQQRSFDLIQLQILRRREPTAFIEFMIIGQIGFGHKTMQLAAGNYCSAIVHLSPNHQRNAHCNGQTRKTAGIIHDLLQSLGTGTLQSFLEKQIRARVTRYSQFRKYHNITALSICLGHLHTNILDIGFHIAYLHCRHGASDSNIIQHGNTSISFFNIIPYSAHFATGI